MNDLFIQGLTIDWNRVRPYNYVRQIPAISGIDTFTFHKPITFLTAVEYCSEKKAGFKR